MEGEHECVCGVEENKKNEGGGKHAPETTMGGKEKRLFGFLFLFICNVFTFRENYQNVILYFKALTQASNLLNFQNILNFHQFLIITFCFSQLFN